MQLCQFMSSQVLVCCRLSALYGSHSLSFDSSPWCQEHFPLQFVTYEVCTLHCILYHSSQYFLFFPIHYFSWKHLEWFHDVFFLMLYDTSCLLHTCALHIMYSLSVWTSSYQKHTGTKIIRRKVFWLLFSSGLV